MFAFVWDMKLDVFSDNSADVALCCLGTWTGNAARVLIKILAGVDYIHIMNNSPRYYARTL